jgi:hypothetical protein
LVLVFKSIKNQRNINLGIEVDRKDNPGARKKMSNDSHGTIQNEKKDPYGVISYCCLFRVCNHKHELLEIIIDGLFGTHRVFCFGSLYDVLIASSSKYYGYWSSGDNFFG